MTKLQQEINNQINNPDSMLHNILNGKPATTVDAGMDNATIVKLAVSFLALGVVLMLIYKFFIQKN